VVALPERDEHEACHEEKEERDDGWDDEGLWWECEPCWLESCGQGGLLVMVLTLMAEKVEPIVRIGHWHAIRKKCVEVYSSRARDRSRSQRRAGSYGGAMNGGPRVQSGTSGA
jgi:hypothetical protein